MPASLLSVINASVLRLEIRVTDEDWAGYDRLEVWRSILGEAGPYEELSADTWVPAIIPRNAGQPSALSGPFVNVVGKSLKLLVNEKIPVTIPFTGEDPLTTAQAARQISEKGMQTVYGFVDGDGVLVVGTLLVGGLVALRVLEGEAATLLGLPTAEPDCVDFGHDPRLPLIVGQTTYAFTDYWSLPSYFYKTRFSNSLTGVRSPFSKPISASQTLGIDPSRIAIGYIKLARGNGRPASSQEITIFNSYKAELIDGTGVVGAPEVCLTDAAGYAEFPLLRGVVYDIGIGGSPVVRRVTVPTDPSVIRFNVLDPIYGEDDNFAVQRSDIPYAERTTL